MEAYATVSEYRRLYPADETEEAAVAAALARAGAAVDGLTFGRIRRKGFAALTEFQQEKIRQAACAQARFYLEYGALLESPVERYGINGVSVALRAGAVREECGVQTTGEVLGLLRQTGLSWKGCLG